MTDDGTPDTRVKLSRGNQALVGFGAVDLGSGVFAYATGVWSQAAPWIAAVTGAVTFIVGVVRFWPWLSKFVKTVDVIGSLPGKLEKIDESAEAKRAAIVDMARDIRAIKDDDRIDRLAVDVRTIAERQQQHEHEVASEQAFWRDAKPVVRKLMAREELGLDLVVAITGPITVTGTEQSA